MNSHDDYEISVGSADEYEDLIAEVFFPGKGGIIISQENERGIFDVSFHSFDSKSAENFDFCKNISEIKVPLSSLMEALDKAVGELRRLEAKQD